MNNITNKTNQLFAHASTAKNLKVHFKGKPWLKNAFERCNAKTVAVTTDYKGNALLQKTYTWDFLAKKHST